jgi:hypothetical protein
LGETIKEIPLDRDVVMKKCPYCAKENLTEKYYCGNCGSYMGSDVPGGLPAHPSIKAKMMYISNPKTTKKKPGRTYKTPEYVQLYHGPKVKRSTYNWLKKKDADVSRVILVWLGLGLLLALVTRCS